MFIHLYTNSFHHNRPRSPTPFFSHSYRWTGEPGKLDSYIIAYDFFHTLIGEGGAPEVEISNFFPWHDLIGEIVGGNPGVYC